jgi:hypothetical protein
MNYSRFIFTILPAAVSMLVLAIWNDVYAQQPYSAQLPPQQANSTGNVPIVLRPLPGGTCPQGYHLVSGSVCIKDLPSSVESQTAPTTNTTNSFPISSPSTTTTSQPNDTNPSNNNEENFGTKILKSFNQEIK